MDDKSTRKPGSDRDRARKKRPRKHEASERDSEFIRAANEDDDGYDPYSDRPPAREQLFERDPWA